MNMTHMKGLFKSTKKVKNDYLTSLDQESVTNNDLSEFMDSSHSQSKEDLVDKAEELSLEKEKNFLLEQQIEKLSFDLQSNLQDYTKLQYENESLRKKNQELLSQLLERFGSDVMASNEQGGFNRQSSSTTTLDSSRFSKLSLQSSSNTNSTNRSSLGTSNNSPNLSTSIPSNQDLIKEVNNYKSYVNLLKKKFITDEKFVMSKIKDFKFNENLLIEKLLTFSNRDHRLIINEILSKLKDTTLSDFEQFFEENRIHELGKQSNSNASYNGIEEEEEVGDREIATPDDQKTNSDLNESVEYIDPGEQPLRNLKDLRKISQTESILKYDENEDRIEELLSNEEFLKSKNINKLSQNITDISIDDEFIERNSARFDSIYYYNESKLNELLQKLEVS